MKFDVTLEQARDGEYIARCAEPSAEGRGPSRESALDRVREEIRFRYEMCPCTGVKDDFVELRVIPRA